MNGRSSSLDINILHVKKSSMIKIQESEGGVPVGLEEYNLFYISIP